MRAMFTPSLLSAYAESAAGLERLLEAFAVNRH